MKTKLLTSLGLAFLMFSCISTKSTLQNVNPSAPNLMVNKENAFIITEYATDEKYGYDKDYPINIFYQQTKNDSINQQRFFNALTGPNGEKLFYKKVGICCPFPSKNSASGAALLDIYEVKWVGQKTPVTLYLNIYEKSEIMVPKGFGLKTF
ncbi:2-dehydro-3-deoxyphosphooctonate aldolase [Flavobacterium sp.]|uniref:2-dehydro-3-deoxyphosphooctonate aldolase n=1 Tax=Flavobacterium sp. TaxID=239 RepID=UPI00262EDBF2|nr:2-dehydro-3-deoxyphosphooctonate aldolase [Flavobacterium sp.]MDD3003869.1 2-dehydro-3-deoxyphosphooctonate aldolase [Flavobacterium sp.]